MFSTVGISWRGTSKPNRLMPFKIVLPCLVWWGSEVKCVNSSYSRCPSRLDGSLHGTAEASWIRNVYDLAHLLVALLLLYTHWENSRYFIKGLTKLDKWEQLRKRRTAVLMKINHYREAMMFIILVLVCEEKDSCAYCAGLVILCRDG